MSTLNVNTIQKIGGGYHNQLTATVYNTEVIGGINWHTSYNATTQTLGSISGAGAGTNAKFLFITMGYRHNNSGASHGYLTGWLFQTGKTYTSDGIYTNNTHYADYANTDNQNLILPWDENGTQSISFYVSSAYNTSSINEYRFEHTLTMYQAS